MGEFYRSSLIHSYNYLWTVRENLLTEILNLAMNGEYEEIGKSFQAGDTYSFDIEQFKGTQDVNLNKLIQFYDELEELMNSLANINAITEEELDIEEDEDYEDDFEDDGDEDSDNLDC